MIIQIQYSNGATRSLKACKAQGYYTAVDATGHGYRVRPRRARELVEEFDALCNEGEARLIAIDEASVRRIRQYNY